LTQIQFFVIFLAQTKFTDKFQKTRLSNTATDQKTKSARRSKHWNINK